MSFKLKMPESELYERVDKLMPKINKAVGMYMQTKSQEYEAYMKTHRKWTDRTGDAKKFLKGSYAMPSENVHRIELAHGVNYGIWLELAHYRKYAIVKPTIDAKGDEVISDLNNLFSKIRF